MRANLKGKSLTQSNAGIVEFLYIQCSWQIFLLALIQKMIAQSGVGGSAAQGLIKNPCGRNFISFSQPFRFSQLVFWLEYLKRSGQQQH